MKRRLSLSLDALAVIDAVARQGSFAGAAKELNKVPSAVSYTVGQLEHRLGILLFDRSARQLTMTAAGIGLLEDARRLLQEASDIERRLYQRAAGWEVVLRIAVDSIFGVQCVFPLIGEFDALETGTQLRFLEESVSGCWESLASNRADLVIAGLGTGGIPTNGGYELHPIGSLPFDFAVAPSHPLAPLARRVNAVTDDELRPYRVIAVADSSRDYRSGGMGLLAGQARLTVATMRDKLAAQIAGLGVGFLPRFMVDPEIEKGTLVKLNVLQPRPNARFCIAHKQEGLGRAGLWFLYQMRTRSTLFAGLSNLI